MNQIGFVEVSHMKNDRLFRALLPMGIPWTEAREALLELSQQIADHVKEAEEQEKLKQEATLLDVLNNENDVVIEAEVLPSE